MIRHIANSQRPGRDLSVPAFCLPPSAFGRRLSPAFRLPPSAFCPKGFILLVVIGVLAVLLTVCVGFLSYTRGEQMAVQAQRNKSDTWDVAHSAVDWVVANICNDLMGATGNMQNGANPLAYTTKPDRFWLRPYEMHLISAFPPRFPNGYMTDGWCATLGQAAFPIKTNVTLAMNGNCEAPWVYLPSDYFPGGGVRGRFAVQVFDTNSCVNINDWNEDCNPSQAQMTHMIIDACGVQQLDMMRQARDTGASGGFQCPFRYQEGWRLATHTCRYPDWTYWDSWRNVDNFASYNWVTKNTCWLSMWGPNYDCMTSFIPSDGLWVGRGPCKPQPYKVKSITSQAYCPVDPPDGNWYNGNGFNTSPWVSNYQGNGNLPWSLAGFVTQAYTDPDTGRSPINVNTCYNSGEVLPLTYWGSQKSTCYTMEAVWNIESLRRLIKVGNFTSPLGGIKSAKAPADWATLAPPEKMKVEQLKTKLAYQYQETLCRYFTGTYAHKNDSRKYPQFGGADISTYAATYGSAKGCTVTDYSSARFNVPLSTFRTNVIGDLVTMSNGTTATTDTAVDFDATDNPVSVLQGKIDVRTACACADNLVPGKPAGLAGFNGFKAYALGDPIWELFNIQLARQEDIDDPYNIDDSVVPLAGAPPNGAYPAGKTGSFKAGNNIYGYWADNPELCAASRWTEPPGPGYFGVQPGTFPDPKGEIDFLDNTGAGPNKNGSGTWCMSLAPKGADICNQGAYTLMGANAPTGPWTDHQVNHVPSRQLCFTPDSFSTELTTSSTTFIIIVNAQLVDGQSVTANPNNPQLHADECWNQWGFVVEVAPDVMAETNPTAEPVNSLQLLSTTYKTTPVQYFGWYKNQMPMYTKTDQGTKPMTSAGWTDDSFQDDMCPSLASFNWGNGNSQNFTTPIGRGPGNSNQQKVADNDQMKNGKWNPGGVTPDLENSNGTVMPDWKSVNPPSPSDIATGCDIHKVPPMNALNGRGADVIYTPANQTNKRVIIRSIWCTNQGIER